MKRYSFTPHMVLKYIALVAVASTVVMFALGSVVLIFHVAFMAYLLYVHYVHAQQKTPDEEFMKPHKSKNFLYITFLGSSAGIALGLVMLSPGSIFTVLFLLFLCYYSWQAAQTRPVHIEF